MTSVPYFVGINSYLQMQTSLVPQFSFSAQSSNLIGNPSPCGIPSHMVTQSQSLYSWHTCLSRRISFLEPSRLLPPSFHIGGPVRVCSMYIGGTQLLRCTCTMCSTILSCTLTWPRRPGYVFGYTVHPVTWCPRAIARAWVVFPLFGKIPVQLLTNFQ